MSDEEYRIYIGTQGWNHPNWQGSYYPDDLPGEWALTYYANEIPVVYLPASENWQEQAEQLLDGSSDKFRFILGLDASQLTKQPDYLQSLQAFSERLLGVVVSLGNDITFNQQLASTIETLNQYRVCIDFAQGKTADQRWQDFMQQAQINPCQYADAQEDVAMPGSLAVTFADQDYDPKGLRQVLEACIQSERDDLTQALILTSPTPSLETLRNAYVIADML